MSMIITWQVLNALTYPKRNKDFARAIFIVAPGLTVKERLQVLMPSEELLRRVQPVPVRAMRQKLNQAEVRIENWHTLMPAAEPKRSVVKKGAESDEAFTRQRAGQAGGAQGHRGDQRRSAPRLSQARRGEDQQEGCRGTGYRPGRGDALD